MRQALYRKYRSKSFDEVVGQEHITKTLRAAIKSDRISHAYLFTGPRGVGKTSVARILAHEVNQIPYKGEMLHLDIIEIDAASNRRIDEIRELRERVRIAPTSARYKVYIIDEVHMLTREAFNALLKTLEEPPAHCIFILATTEAHKLPETIISRTQRFEFKPVGPSQVSRHLSSIAKREKIIIEPAALDLLADFGQGSFRDSISYLDQLSTRPGNITADDVRSILGLPTDTEVKSLLSNINNGDLAKSIDNLRAIRDQGVEAAQAAAALSSEIRILAAAGSSGKSLISLLKQLLEVPASPKPYDCLEIAVLETAQQNQKESVAGPADHIITSADDEARPSPKTAKPVEGPSKEIEPDAAGDLDIARWGEVVDRAKDEAASIYTALRLALPKYENGALTLNFQFPLHQKKLEQAANKRMVAALIHEVYGVNPSIHCLVDKSVFKASPTETAADIEIAPPLTSINNIFGGAEVLES